MSPRFVVGIDLGTTHTALAAVDLEAGDESPRVLALPQLIAEGTLEAQPLLPSFAYFAPESEPPLALPWDASRRFAVGEHARKRASETPQRVISSAKSWLCHAGIDRRGPILPHGGADDIEKISPVEASFRYLDHLAEAFQAEHGLALGDQEVYLTVPASFDAIARDLTIEAAYAAGLSNVTLLEEPQAALYAWIARSREKLSPGDVVLVIDIGGGTTDFSAIRAGEEHGALTLSRIAVGDHILLGGDNMDLALAHVVKTKLVQAGKEPDRWQMVALTHACRGAKERLLSDPQANSVNVSVLGRGSQLLGNTLSAELTRAEVTEVLVEGFFPRTGPEEKPKTRARGALTEIGLPYASDPAITKHLARFLARQSLQPTAVLMNGGVVKGQALRERLLETLGSWLGAPPRLLPDEDPDLAVARGAAYYGLVRRGKGLRIRGGTARAYYVGIESPAPAVPGVEPPLVAMCVAPFGMEEGSAAELPEHELGLVVGEPVSFRFFGSSVRRDDPAGKTLERWGSDELLELSPIEITLPPEGREEGDVVRVRLSVQVTPVGTLLLEAIPIESQKPDERWKIELGVRAD